MNEYNIKLVGSVVDAVNGLETGECTVADVQSVLQAAIPLFESDGSGVADDVSLAEADLEEIQFTMLLAEQLPAALFRLDDLRASLLQRLP